MKGINFNKILLYLCDELKDDYDLVTTFSLCNDLKIAYQPVYRALSALKILGYLKIDLRGTKLNSYFGIFKNKKLKLNKFKKFAERRLKDFGIENYRETDTQKK